MSFKTAAIDASFLHQDRANKSVVAPFINTTPLLLHEPQSLPYSGQVNTR